MKNYCVYAIANRANRDEWFYVGEGRTFDPGRTPGKSGRIYDHIVEIDLARRGKPSSTLYEFLASLSKDGTEIEFLILDETDLKTEAFVLEQAFIAEYRKRFPRGLPFNKQHNGFFSTQREDCSEEVKKALSQAAEGKTRGPYRTFLSQLSDGEKTDYVRLLHQFQIQKALMGDPPSPRLTRLSVLKNKEIQAYKKERYAIVSRIRKKERDQIDFAKEEEELQILDEKYGLKHQPYLRHDWISRGRARLSLEDEANFVKRFTDETGTKLRVDAPVGEVHREFEKITGRPITRVGIYLMLQRNGVECPRKTKYGSTSAADKAKRKLLIAKLNQKIKTATKYGLVDALQILAAELKRVTDDGSVSTTSLMLDELVVRRREDIVRIPRELPRERFVYKQYADDEVGPNRDLFLLVGASGAGKSWVGSQLHQAVVLDSDKLKGKLGAKIQVIVDQTFQEKPIAYETGFQISTLLKHLPSSLKVRIYAIVESADVVEARLVGRGSEKGLTDSGLDRMKRIESLARRKGEFHGTAQQVLDTLLSLKL